MITNGDVNRLMRHRLQPGVINKKKVVWNSSLLCLSSWYTFYDCPGFGSWRDFSAAHHIMSTQQKVRRRLCFCCAIFIITLTFSELRCTGTLWVLFKRICLSSALTSSPMVLKINGLHHLSFLLPFPISWLLYSYPRYICVVSKGYLLCWFVYAKKKRFYLQFRL